MAALFKLGFACLLLWGLIGLFYYALSLRYDLREIAEMPQRSAIYDARDELYTRLSGENRVTAPFDRVSNHFINALIAREDTRFYQHIGVDPVGIARAAARNLVMGGIRQGGSTITQQLARNSFPLGGRNFHRKLLEAALSFRIETELEKEEILEHYMNRIYFGSGFYGVETASQAYFGKPAARLTLSESALLAGLIRSPTRLSPFNDLDASIQQRNVVLRRMQELGLATSGEVVEALREPVRLSTAPRPRAPQENWAVDSIRRELEQVLPRHEIDEGGLRIFTTIDPGLQAAAERTLAERLNEIESWPGYPHADRASVLRNGGSDYVQGAVFAMDNRNGAVRAIVGGRDYSHSKFNRALLGHRPPGSAIKPFVFAEAFARGLRPRDRIDDSPLRPEELPPAHRDYNPANADGEYGPPRPARDGLVESRNTMTVRVGMRAGLDRVAATFARAGLADDPPPAPALCLGAFETTLRDLTSAYTAFATGGSQIRPYLIRKVLNSHGQVLYETKQIRSPLLDLRASRMTAEILEDVFTRGTASGARALGLRRRAAGKTGTSNAYRDAWFIGFTGQLTCGVWVGFDEPKTILRGGSGARLALPVWVDVIESEPGRRLAGR